MRIYHWLAETPAWRSLDGNSRSLYLLIAGRYAGAGSNNGRIPYSVREAAAELRIGKATASACFKALQDRGFIVGEKLGHFDTKLLHSTEWRLTEFPSDIDNKWATKEFANWRPPEGSALAEKLKPRIRRGNGRVLTALRLSSSPAPSPVSQRVSPGKLEVYP